MTVETRIILATETLRIPQMTDESLAAAEQLLTDDPHLAASVKSALHRPGQECRGASYRSAFCDSAGRLNAAGIRMARDIFALGGT